MGGATGRLKPNSRSRSDSNIKKAPGTPEGFLERKTADHANFADKDCLFLSAKFAKSAVESYFLSQQSISPQASCLFGIHVNFFEIADPVAAQLLSIGGVNVDLIVRLRHIRRLLGGQSTIGEHPTVTVVHRVVS